MMNNTNNAYNEKRDLIRMNMSCDISVSTNEKQFTASCLDLSGSGIGFTTEEDMSIGDVVDIDIYPKNNITSPLYATAEVVWIKGNEKGALIRIKN
ncbi:MAG: PilZ domain-containing protein [Methylococcales bacterium]|jgi:hypothetical protein|nr:PilZ domain-containing protein [Methylococcales bacterium]MBT7444531.1 PilZ domain-containing protein [Methylococcales bacterium]